MMSRTKLEAKVSHSRCDKEVGYALKKRLARASRHVAIQSTRRSEREATAKAAVYEPQHVSTQMLAALLVEPRAAHEYDQSDAVMEKCHRDFGELDRSLNVEVGEWRGMEATEAL